MTRATFIVLLCWLTGLVCGSMATMAPVYMPVIVKDLTGSAEPGSLGTAAAMLQSLFLSGWVVGGIALGVAADKFGRTLSLIMALGIAGLACIAGAWADTVLTLAILRLCAGVGVGAMMVLNITVGAEHLSHKHRPWMMGVLANAYAVGIILTGAIQAMEPNWRTTMIALGASLVLIPMFLPFRRTIDAVQQPPADAVRTSATMTEHRTTIIMASLLYGSMLIVLWAAFTWLPSWATSLHPGTDAGAALRGRIMGALGIGGIIGSLFSGPLAVKIGRVRTLIVCYIGAVVPSLALYLTAQPSATLFPVLAGCMSFFFGMSQGLMALYIPELFPTSIRAGSVGIAFNAGRILTALAVVNIGVIVSWTGGFREALLVFTFPLVIGTFFSFRAPEPDPAMISSHS